MASPRKNSSRLCRYKGFVDEKVPAKRNCYREDSANQLFLFARVSYREELVAKFKEECRMYTNGHMNKTKMEPAAAMSHYHQQFRFFLREDSPNFADHDFPNPGCFIICSGYQMLKPLQEIIEEEYSAYELNDFLYEEDSYEENIDTTSDTGVNLFTDKLGRKHFNRFTSGPASCSKCKYNSQGCRCIACKRFVPHAQNRSKKRKRGRFCQS